MPDRIPVGTHPGLVAALVDVDLIVGTFPSSVTVSGVFLRRQGAGAGDVVTAELRNATGGGGDSLAIAFPDGAGDVAVSGVLEGTELYLRVTAADANSQNLSGWVALEAAPPGITTALTSLARVKAHLAISGSGDDAELTTLIATVSEGIERWIGRRILSESIVGEVRSGPVHDDRLVLARRPIVSVEEVRHAGVAIPAAEIEFAAEAGVLFRRAAGDTYSAAVWEAGSRNLAVDYTAGYASVPEDLAQAATLQVAYVFSKRRGKIGDRGTVLDAGGSASYLTGPWAPTVAPILETWRTRELG